MNIRDELSGKGEYEDDSLKFLLLALLRANTLCKIDFHIKVIAYRETLQCEDCARLLINGRWTK